MIDTTLVAFAYAFIGFAALVAALAVATLVVAVRDLRRRAAPTVLPVAGPAERDFCRAA